MIPGRAPSLLLGCALAVTLCATVLFGASCGGRDGGEVKPPNGETPAVAYAPGRIIVEFEADVDAEKRDRVIEECGGREVIEPLGPGPENTFLVMLEQDVSVEEAVERFEASESVVYAEPDYIRTIR